MEVTVLLADAATYDVNGRVAAIGLGWEITGPSPLPAFNLIVIIKTPVGWGDKPLDVRVQLRDGDGLVLDPGLYSFVVSVNDEARSHWRRPFYVRAKPDEFPPQISPVKPVSD